MNSQGLHPTLIQSLLENLSELGCNSGTKPLEANAIRFDRVTIAWDFKIKVGKYKYGKIEY